MTDEARVSNKRKHGPPPSFLLQTWISGTYDPRRGSGRYILEHRIELWRDAQPPPARTEPMRLTVINGQGNEARP